MASQTLTDQTVASTYQGVLHANGEALPQVGIATVYDGLGQTSALSLGLSGKGAAIAGGLSCSAQLTAGDIRYTTTDSTSGANFPLVSNGNKTAVFGQMTSNALIDLSPSPAGRYGNVQYLAVNSKGLVTNVIGGPETASAWATFDGRDVPFTYVINNLTVTCTAVAHSIKQGNIITIKNATNTGLNGSFAVQSSDIAGNTFTFANPTGTTTGSGNGTVDVTVKSSYNVSSVTRVSTGIFRVNFSAAFKNQDYVTLCGAKFPNTTTTDLENLQANTVSAAKGNVTVRSFYITSGNQVTEYDDGYISVYCIGSTVEDNAPTPVSFDNFINTNYFWSEGAQPGTITTTQTITPAIMAANKWTVVIIGGYVSFSCRSGAENMRSTVLVNGTTTSSMERGSSQNSNADAYLYHVFYYTNNQLKYANFHYSNTGWSTYTVHAWDKSNYTAASDIYKGLAAQGAIVTNQIANATQAGSGSWLLNFLSQNSASLTNIQSANVSYYSVAGRANDCYGGYVMWQNFVRYFTPQ